MVGGLVDFFLVCLKEYCGFLIFGRGNEAASFISQYHPALCWTDKFFHSIDDIQLIMRAICVFIHSYKAEEKLHYTEIYSVVTEEYHLHPEHSIRRPPLSPSHLANQAFTNS